MRKVSFVKTVITFSDVYGNQYREPFICRSFLSLGQIFDLCEGMNDSDGEIDWNTLSLKMSFVKISCLTPIK